MKQIIDFGILLISILMMMAVGLDLAPQHFKATGRQKKTLALILVAQFILLPMLGVVLIRMLALPPHVSAGVLLLAACPNGDIVNYYTWLARANVALAVTMTVISFIIISQAERLSAESQQVAFNWCFKRIIISACPLVDLCLIFPGQIVKF
ncbi:MAG: bile acid:sodium symporter family protein [bacterium]